MECERRRPSPQKVQNSTWTAPVALFQSPHMHAFASSNAKSHSAPAELYLCCSSVYVRPLRLQLLGLASILSPIYTLLVGFVAGHSSILPPQRICILLQPHVPRRIISLFLLSRAPLPPQHIQTLPCLVLRAHTFCTAYLTFFPFVPLHPSHPPTIPRRVICPYSISLKHYLSVSL